ncbi:MAG TPA: alpha-amylase family glycosyl hydrolase [Puia sp.]|nr:alpha-amylase family glycosyl hydrolase [Puia sp.]
MKSNLFFTIIALFTIAQTSFTQTPAAVYPTNWWVGMKWNKVQVMIHKKDIGVYRDVKLSYPGVQLVKVEKLSSPNYLFLNLDISPGAKPGVMKIKIRGNEGEQVIDYQLRSRRGGNGKVYAQGVTSADLIYLIMPDRFSNGEGSNDKFADMNDTSCDRSNPFLRHGGDLQGISKHLDYFNDLGVTTLWLTPVVENDQSLTNEGSAKRSAYHGYAFTDQYKVDRRFGGNEEYKKMIDAAHARGLKIIQDAVYNHVGDNHFLFLDKPSKDWFNQWPSYTNTTYKDQPLVDPYASKSDYNIAVNGWFTTFMPDLNQRNPYVANFLIQYAIWAVEEYGIDGWRVDTYFYSDRDFLNNINQALYHEFPHITVFGENTMQSVTEQAYYAQNNISTSWKSNLQGVIDFQWEGSVLRALNEHSGWSSGVTRIYNVLVQDILYKDPMRNEILLDNHDQDRFYSVMGEDFDKYKMGILLLLTQRGIPQLYYGTEILMKNFKNPSDAEVRKDFPGGWKGDSVNKFVASGRTQQENEAYDYVKKLSHFRENSSAIKWGKLMQFVPTDGLYTYFRYDSTQTLMVTLNTNDTEITVMVSRFIEITKGFTKMKNVMTGSVTDLKDFKLSAKQGAVFELTN